MLGKIKFVDVKSGNWGYIIPDDGTADVGFQQRDVVGRRLAPDDAGADVEFDLHEDGEKRHARRVTLRGQDATPMTSGVSSPEPAAIPAPRAPSRSATEARELTSWAFIVWSDFINRESVQYYSVLPDLARMALEERWFFGATPDDGDEFPILENYLKYTYWRLRRENKVVEGENLAAFNTGLVDRLYDPIFALFERNDLRNPKPWRFRAICVPGKGAAGKQLTEVFDPTPEAASYFQSNFDMLLDTTKQIHVDYDHVIIDGVSRDRFPPAFLAQYPPKKFSACDYTQLDRNAREEYLTKLAEAIGEDLQTMRGIKRRLEDAKVLAEKRTRWNYKTAIPQYYPRQDMMSLLLPLAIVDDEKVDLALVVTKNPSGSYQGRTIFPLDWAYQNARLVCRPDSDWLVTERVSATSSVASPPPDA